MLKRKKANKSHLHLHMARSYVVVTLVSVLIVESLAYIPLALLISSFLEVHIAIPLLHNQALLYASESTNFLPDPATESAIAAFFAEDIYAPAHTAGASLQIPPITTLYPDSQSVMFVLFISPAGQILGSSYPKRYPLQTPVGRALADRAFLVTQALHGTESTAASDQAMGRVISVAQPVWNAHHRIIGALYIQAPLGSFFNVSTWFFLLLQSSLLLLIFTVPIGGIFGFLTTRPLVRRIRSLAQASAQFARGDYPQQVPIDTLDELGQLERQFNDMVIQLTESNTRHLTLAVQNARLKERARISRDLHDAISQDLFSLRMLARGLCTAIESRTDLPVYIETLEDAVSHMQREMRALLLELRPGQLEDLGLVAALQDLAQTYSSRVGVTIETRMQEGPLSIQAEHALFRIAQEALSNAVRHSEATTITLNLQVTKEGTTFCIADDGVGFVMATEQQQDGFGLSFMEERIQELQGTFTLETQPGQGTCIRIHLPLSTSEDT